MHRRDDGSFGRTELPDDPMVVIGSGFDLPDENDPAIQAEAAQLEAQVRQMANYLQGLPQREELKRIEESVNGLLARETV